MDVPVRSLSGGTAGTVALDDRVFGIEPNLGVLHQAVVAHQANMRHGTASTLTRGLVAGGGKKPWRQKGTGRARQGSTRAPHWRGGGAVFGPHPRSYHQRLPRKMRRLALRSALSAKAASGAVVVVDRFELAEGRTRAAMAALATLHIEGSVVIVVGFPSEEIRRATGNLPTVHVALPNGLSVLDLIRADSVVFSQEALAPVTELLLGGNAGAAA